VIRCPRIGVNYAGPWALRPYRFVDPDSDFISVKPNPSTKRLQRRTDKLDRG
jgi:3-methyladenine DNA glycosylase Mpg